MAGRKAQGQRRSSNTDCGVVEEVACARRGRGRCECCGWRRSLHEMTSPSDLPTEQPPTQRTLLAHPSSSPSVRFLARVRVRVERAARTKCGQGMRASSATEPCCGRSGRHGMAVAFPTRAPPVFMPTAQRQQQQSVQYTSSHARTLRVRLPYSNTTTVLARCTTRCCGEAKSTHTALSRDGRQGWRHARSLALPAQRRADLNTAVPLSHSQRSSVKPRPALAASL